jgi:hypothetical protein
MNAQRRDLPRNLPPEPSIIEVDGPAMAYFEIPLDYWATTNGEIEAPGHPESARMVQRIVYINFTVADTVRVQTILSRVTERLNELGGGYIWWRRRPTKTEDGRMHLRLGTTPGLPDSWWRRLSDDVGNGDLGHNVPGIPG